jgi:restriction system protein
LLKVYEGMHQIFLKTWPGLMEEAKRTGKGIDPTQFVRASEKGFGLTGAAMALEFVEEFSVALEQSPWTRIRRIEWTDTAALTDLFESEKVEEPSGGFIDQRFIDYLQRNFESIDKINWRKFEGLVAEFFARAGLYPELGAGRNDDGVDVRVWPSRRARHLPPALLIQCKRQKEKVGKVVVKALWADVEHEGAEAGLIVATTAVSPGGQKVASAHAYPIKVADRATLRRWFEVLRTPYSGVFMGE